MVNAGAGNAMMIFISYIVIQFYEVKTNVPREAASLAVP